MTALQSLTYKSLLSKTLFLNLQPLSENAPCTAVYLHRTIFEIM